MGRDFVQGYMVAEAFNASNGTVEDGLAIKLIEVCITKVLIGGMIAEHGIDYSQDGMSNCEYRSLATSTGSEAMIHGRQICAFGVCRSPGYLNQD